MSRALDYAMRNPRAMANDVVAVYNSAQVMGSAENPPKRRKLYGVATSRRRFYPRKKTTLRKKAYYKWHRYNRYKSSRRYVRRY